MDHLYSAPRRSMPASSSNWLHTTMMVKKPQKRRPSPVALVSQRDAPAAALRTASQPVTAVNGPSGGPPGAGAQR
eukprot:jgi/Chrpa1/8490/Chrysochromulina_OHIO_Genome00015682-RA